MEGAKFKLWNRRPYWWTWSYTYPEQLTYRQKLIQVLRQTLERLEADEAASIEGELTPPAHLIMQPLTITKDMVARV